MNYCVFIHTNHKQRLGALVAEYALRRYSTHNDQFQVKIIFHSDYPFLQAHEGEWFLRGGKRWQWRNDDLQSFTPLRFMPPELMNYQGRAIVIDPDVFAVSDIWELLSNDMKGHAVLCRRRPGQKGFASSVMVLDCSRLTHWHCETQFGELFTFQRDYLDWITLKYEPIETIGIIADEWNDFDRLTAQTKLLHNTKRQTQPWKTGLPIDFRPAEKFRWFPPKGWGKRILSQLGINTVGRYSPHPDPQQERFFFGLLRECLEKGVITETLLREEMRQDHLRHDAFTVIERTPPLSYVVH